MLFAGARISARSEARAPLLRETTISFPGRGIKRGTGELQPPNRPLMCLKSISRYWPSLGANAASVGLLT
jgi:hypothetical protein